MKIFFTAVLMLSFLAPFGANAEGMNGPNLLKGSKSYQRIERPAAQAKTAAAAPDGAGNAARIEPAAGAQSETLSANESFSSGKGEKSFHERIRLPRKLN